MALACAAAAIAAAVHAVKIDFEDPDIKARWDTTAGDSLGLRLEKPPGEFDPAARDLHGHMLSTHSTRHRRHGFSSPRQISRIPQGTGRCESIRRCGAGRQDSA